VKAEQSLAIFWSKKSRNDAARVEWDSEDGRVGGVLRDSSEFIADQSFLGWSEREEMMVR